MKKYNVVSIQNFEDEDDFRYVMKLLEDCGYIFHFPINHLISKINWKTARIYSSPKDANQLYVTDTNDEMFEIDRTIDLNKYI